MNWENSQILITSGRQLLTIIKTLEFQAEVVPLNLIDQALVGLQQDLLRVSRTVTQSWTATELNTIWPVGEWDNWWNRMSSTLLQLLDLLAIWRRQQKLISALTFDCQKCLLHSLASTSGLQHLLQAPVDWSRWNTEELPILRTILSLRGAHSLEEPETRPVMVGPPPPAPLFSAPQGQTLQRHQLSFATPPPCQSLPPSTEHSPQLIPSPSFTPTPQQLHQPWTRTTEQHNKHKGDTQRSSGSPSQGKSPQHHLLEPHQTQPGTPGNQTLRHLNKPPPLAPKPTTKPSTPPGPTPSQQIPPLMSTAPRFFREIQVHQDGRQPPQEKNHPGSQRRDSKETNHRPPQDNPTKNSQDQPDQIQKTSGNI